MKTPRKRTTGKGKKPSRRKAAAKPAAVEPEDLAPEAADEGEPPKEAVETRGRKTKYKPEFAAVARFMCKSGATDYELACEFGVHTATIWRWAGKHPAFCKALKVEKGEFDERVKRSLGQRAAGYSYNAVKIMQFEGAPVRAEYIEHVPPDVAAAKLWLMNRCGWKDKVEVDAPADGVLAKAIAVTEHMILALTKTGGK